MVSAGGVHPLRTPFFCIIPSPSERLPFFQNALGESLSVGSIRSLQRGNPKTRRFQSTPRIIIIKCISKASSTWTTDDFFIPDEKGEEKMVKKRVNHERTTFQEKIEAGLSFEGAQRLLQDFLSEWLMTIRSSLRARTCDQYEQIVRDHIAPNLAR